MMETIRKRGETLMRRFPEVAVADPADIQAMYLAAAEAKEEMDRHTDESERLMRRADDGKTSARADFIRARDAANVIEKGSKRLSRMPAEKIKEAKAELTRVGEKWNATVMPTAGVSDGEATWLGVKAFEAELERRVVLEEDAAAKAREKEKDLRARAGQAQQERKNQEAQQKTNQTGRDRTLKIAQAEAGPVRAAWAERERLVAMMTPEQVVAADEKRDTQLIHDRITKAAEKAALEQASAAKEAAAAAEKAASDQARQAEQRRRRQATQPPPAPRTDQGYGPSMHM